MKWYDAAEDAKRRNAALDAEARKVAAGLTTVTESQVLAETAKRHEPFAEGCSYRPYDGTPYGQWRVTRDAPDADTWSVWDMRRGVPLRPVGLLVIKGLMSAQAGVAVAEWYAAHRVLRAGHAVYRALSTAAAIVREEWRL